jgi:hypothetical protein
MPPNYISGCSMELLFDLCSASCSPPPEDNRKGGLLPGRGPNSNFFSSYSLGINFGNSTVFYVSVALSPGLNDLGFFYILLFNPNFSVEKFSLGDDDPDPYGQDVVVNPDLQIVLQFVASATVVDFAFQLQKPG